MIALTREEPNTVDGLLDYLHTEQSPGKIGAEELLKLAQRARQELERRIDAERTRLLAYARSNIETLTKRPHIAEIPRPSYTDEVKVRRIDRPHRPDAAR